MKFQPKHWPRGKYNGRRIVGINIQFRIDILRWQKPWMHEMAGAITIVVGPVILNIEANYEYKF